MAKTLENYDPLVQVPASMTPANGTFPIVESHDILVGASDKRLDAKLDEIDTAISGITDGDSGGLNDKVDKSSITTSVAAASSAVDTKIPTEKAVRTAIDSKTITVDSSVTSGSTNAVSGGAVYTALNNKVDKVTGKQLSTEDYTSAEKTKLAGVATGATNTPIVATASTPADAASAVETNVLSTKATLTAIDSAIDAASDDFDAAAAGLQTSYNTFTAGVDAKIGEPSDAADSAATAVWPRLKNAENEIGALSAQFLVANALTTTDMSDTTRFYIYKGKEIHVVADEADMTDTTGDIIYNLTTAGSTYAVGLYSYDATNTNYAALTAADVFNITIEGSATAGTIYYPSYWYYYDTDTWKMGSAMASVDVDPTLSVSGAAADAKVTGDQLTELSNDYVDTKLKVNNIEEKIIPKYNKYIVDWWISSVTDNYFKVTTQNGIYYEYKSLLIPIDEESKITICSNSDKVTALFFLKAFNPIEYQSSLDDRSDIKGERINIPRIDTIINIPSDCKYIFILMSSTVEDYMPITLYIDDENYLQSQLDKIENKVDNAIQLIQNNVEEDDQIEFVYGSIIPCSTSPVNLNNKANSTKMKHAIIECSEGDEFYINCIGGTGARAYCFIDDEYTILEMAASKETVIRKIIAPENATYLILNNTDNEIMDKPSYIGVPIDVKVELVETRVENLENNQNFNTIDVDYLRALKIAQLPFKTDFDLFVFAGQSNMMGASAIPATDISLCNYAFEYKYNPKRKGAATGAFEYSQHPAGEWSYKDIQTAYAAGNTDVNGKSKTAYYNTNTYFICAMANKDGNTTDVKSFSSYSESTAQIGQSIPPYFALEYASYGNPCIYAHMSKGGVKIEYYFDNDVKDFFVEKYNSMLTDFATLYPNRTIRNKCFVWCQGESNAGDADYKDKLNTLWTWARGLGFDKFLCIRVGFFGSSSISTTMRLQEEFCNENDNCYIITRAMSFMPYPGMPAAFYTQTPSEEYQNCRDSFFGYSNDHINEKGNILVAKRMAYNVDRILNKGLDPILEAEIVAGI